MVKKHLGWMAGLLLTTLVIVIVVTFFYRIKIIQSRTALGTKVTITVLSKNQRHGIQLVEQAFKEIERLEKIYSDQRSDSELAKLNQSPTHQWIQVSNELEEIIEQAYYWHQQSKGLFDITVGTLGSLWGFKSDQKPTLPNLDQLKQVRKKIGMDQLLWDSEKQAIQFKQKEMQLDLGGLAKLVILQKLKQFFEKQGHRQYLINLGGDVLAGDAQPLKKWTIGIADPKSPEQLNMQLKLINSLVLSSGDYYRSFEQDKTIYHHIFNPKTGYPSVAVNAVTLVMPSDCHQPIPSIVIFLLGLENGMTLIEAHPQIEGMIFHDDQLTHSSGMKNYLKL